MKKRKAQNLIKYKIFLQKVLDLRRDNISALVYYNTLAEIKAFNDISPQPSAYRLHAVFW